MNNTQINNEDRKQRLLFESEQIHQKMINICEQLEECKGDIRELEQKLRTLRSIGIENLRELNYLNSNIKKIV